MYYRHFGLSGAPFQFTPSPKLLFMSKAHREALAALEWGLLYEPSGFTLLIGETGVGKTTLIVSILARSYERVRTAYVNNPKLGFDGMLRDILRQLQVTAPMEKLAMVDAFDQFLGRLSTGERVVIIVDEAQALSDEMLEELRLFSNRGRLDEKQVHFVFAGQPALLNRLMTPELKQINERIGVRALLNPLERGEASAYVEYRLAAFGGSSSSIFGRRSIDYLMDHSGGIPRRINVLCHNSMLAAYNKNQSTVGIDAARLAVAEYENLFSQSKHFQTANHDSDLSDDGRQTIPAHMGWPATIVGGIAVAAMGVFLFWNSGTPGREEHVRVDTNTLGDAVTEHPAPKFLPTAIISADSRDVVSSGRDMRTPAVGESSEAPDGSRGLGSRWVRVRPGDTLERIAAAHLGSADQVNRLIASNPQLHDANHIYAGEIVNLPGPSEDGSPLADQLKRATQKNGTEALDEE